MRFYRVLFYNEDAGLTEPGGVLYVPPQGPYRIDNPEHYAALYAGETPAGVCAESFYRGRHRQEWSVDMLRPLPNGDRRVLAWYDFREDAAIGDLDDPNVLASLSLRPSSVITRDYTVSQSWALAIFKLRKYSGVRWWSYCDARWASLGLWDRSAIVAHGVEELRLDHPALLEAARVLDVHIRPRPGSVRLGPGHR